LSAETDLLFVVGGQSSGTSTLVGTLNAHPDIFLLYETRMNRTAVSRYGNQLLDSFPEVRPYFRGGPDVGQPYKQLAAFLNDKLGKSYRYIGDKLITLDADGTFGSRPYRTIFALRDIRTWLCKKQIVKWYRTDLDIVAPALTYLAMVCRSCGHQLSYRVPLEQLIEQHESVVDGLSGFLDLDLRGPAAEWWLHVGDYDSGDPKGAQDWASVHPSSRRPPTTLDTTVEIKSHPFWDEFLPLFEKYYGSGCPDPALAGEIAADLEKAENLMRFAPLPLAEAFGDIETANFGAEPKPGNPPSSPAPAPSMMDKVASAFGLGRKDF